VRCWTTARNRLPNRRFKEPNYDANKHLNRAIVGQTVHFAKRYPLTLAVVLAGIGLTGAGKLSLDARLITTLKAKREMEPDEVAANV
jgi:hypothetical protein